MRHANGSPAPQQPDVFWLGSVLRRRFVVRVLLQRGSWYRASPLGARKGERSGFNLRDQTQIYRADTTLHGSDSVSHFSPSPPSAAWTVQFGMIHASEKPTSCWRHLVSGKGGCVHQPFSSGHPPSGHPFTTGVGGQE